MMTWVFAGLMLAAVLFGMLTGRMELVSTAAIQEGTKAVQLVLTLMGGICLWSGLMKIADQAGVTRWLSRGMSPIMKRLFPGVKPQSPAAKAISMNVAANLLGLGNAATPLGIAAMKELAPTGSRTATNDMITFVVLNTASIQLIPTTTALLRLQAGSASPMDILPAVWLSSLASVMVGLTVAFLLSKLQRQSWQPGRNLVVAGGRHGQSK